MELDTATGGHVPAPCRTPSLFRTPLVRSDAYWASLPPGGPLLVQCSQNCTDVICDMRAPARDCPRCLMMALYPHAGASAGAPKDNATAAQIQKQLDQSEFEFVDALGKSPKGHAKDMPLKTLDQLLTNSTLAPDFARDQWRRAQAVMVCEHDIGNTPVLYFAGRTLEGVFGIMLSLRFFSLVEVVSEQFGVALFKFEHEQREIVFYASVGNPHPSAALMAHGRSSTRHALNRAFSVVKILLDHRRSTVITEAELLAGLGAAAGAYIEGRSKVSLALGFGDSGRFPISLRYLRHLNLANHKDVTRLLSWVEEVGAPTARCVLDGAHGFAYQLVGDNPSGASNELGSDAEEAQDAAEEEDNDDARQRRSGELRIRFKWFSDQHGADFAVQLFSTSGFSKRVMDIDFFAVLKAMIGTLGQDAARLLFSGGSFCTRILDDDFRSVLKEMIETLGQDAARLLFSGDSFSTRVLEDDFRSVLKEMIETLGQDAARLLFSGGSFCTRILDDDFRNVLKEMIRTLGQDAARLLFSRSSFSTRVLDDAFRNMLAQMIERLGQDAARKLFTTNSFCTRIQNLDFMARLNGLIPRLGEDEARKLFCRDSFSAAIVGDGFLEQFQARCAKFGDNGARKLYSTNQFCTRSLRPDFNRKVDDAVDRTDLETARLVFSVGVFCTGVDNDAFLAAFYSIVEKIGKAPAATFFQGGNSRCTKIKSNAGCVEQFLREVDRYGVKDAISRFDSRNA